MSGNITDFETKGINFGDLKNNLHKSIAEIRNGSDISKVREGLYLMYKALLATMERADSFKKMIVALHDRQNILAEVQKKMVDDVKDIADALGKTGALCIQVAEDQEKEKSQTEQIVNVVKMCSKLAEGEKMIIEDQKDLRSKFDLVVNTLKEFNQSMKNESELEVDLTLIKNDSDKK